ncbi:hypothetical protein C2S53_005418 [Perilla frutescens var. hirtella]|uniref:Protein kinase domain-containing protein n=1 Tax=Perilla frutescens var. hirtella TaxID=608512 RepID=A0AAD4PF57_PERFH|nr:hypothetical protein C2S53_005418 [Perilla frutescens var. hirtella]
METISFKYWNDCVDPEDLEAMWAEPNVRAEWIGVGETKGSKVHLSRDPDGQPYLTQTEMRAVAGIVVQRHFVSQIDSDMLCAIAEIESGRQILARSYKKKSNEVKMGIMQISPKIAEWLIRELGYRTYDVAEDSKLMHKPFLNVYLAAAYFKWLSNFDNKERSEEYMVRAYKGGTKKATHKSTLPYWKKYLSVKESLPSRKVFGISLAFAPGYSAAEVSQGKGPIHATWDSRTSPEDMEAMWNNPNVNKEWTKSGEKKGNVRFSHDVEKHPYLSRVEIAAVAEIIWAKHFSNKGGHKTAVLCALGEMISMRFVNGVGQHTGIMGIDYPTARWLNKDLGYKGYSVDSVEDLTKPFVSMYFGAAYMTWLSEYEGRERSLQFIVQAYLCGPHNVNIQETGPLWDKFEEVLYRYQNPKSSSSSGISFMMMMFLHHIVSVRIVVLLCGYCKLFTEFLCQQLSPLDFYLKEEKYSMEPLKNHNIMQYSTEHGNEDHGPVSLVHRAGASGHASSSLKPPENNFSELKPVHNYSIQTGEEFALEFMRDRVNPKIPFIPNICGDPSYAPGYLELKGILGISHTGSESGSDIPMVATIRETLTEIEQRNLTLHGNRGNHGSFQAMPPHASSDYNSQCTLMHASSGTSDGSSLKLKVLCSFGGKILPRPSDGKLRYVGGETRIIRISKDITWRELWLKTTAIYDETHAIKYQLPGEDLDALVSVSSDEDLLNMMEECNVLNGKEESRKFRMFLFSLEDLEEAHFSLANTDGDSEMKYVVAVNGMDIGSRKSSTFRGLANSSGSNLNKLNTINVERDTCRTSNEFLGINTSDMAGFVVPPTVSESSKSILPNSSNVYETVHFYHGPIVHRHDDKHHHPHFGYNLHPFYNTPLESVVPQSSYEAISQHKGLEGKSPGSSDAQGTQIHEKEAKLKVDGSIQPESRSNVNREVNFPVEESPIVIPKLDRDFSSTKTEGRPQESVRFSKPNDAVDTSQLSKSNGEEYCASGNAPVPESVNSESDPNDAGHSESSTPPQRVFYSERIPREQAELLNRISKSDDSRGSQFLVNQSHADTTQQDLVSGSAENLQNGNADIPTEQLISTNPIEPETFDNGHHRNQMVDALDVKESLHENQVLTEAEAGLKLPAESHEGFTQHSEDPTAHWVDGVGCQLIANDAHEHSQLPTTVRTQEESKAALPRTEQGDILIDINDRFPRNLLSDIFSKAVLSDSSSVIGPLPKDGAGLSVNIENHEPKHWSFFQRLAGDGFMRRDVSLIDQDHVVFSSGLTKVEEEAPLAYDFVPLTSDGIPPTHPGFQDTCGEDDQKDIPAGDEPVSLALHSNYDASHTKVTEGIQYSDLMDNMRIPDLEYEDGIRNIGLPPLDPSLVDFDMNALQIIQNADLEELRELGSGTFGTVYHGKWRGSDVAIKRIKKSCFTGRQSEQERLTNEFWREAEILSKLHHPNVVAFYGVVQDGPGGTLATVTEYMVDGSLRHVLLRKDRHLDRRKRLIIAMDAAFGMEYLHSKNIVHFDLKCDNLLVNLKDPSRPICKVGDFGLSKIKRNTLVSGGVRGTLPWMAPELLNGSSNKVSEKVDVFSFGIVLWEILTGEEPYANMHYGAIIGGIVNNTLRPMIPSYCDSEWRLLMEQCWAPNPVVRPSFTEIASRLRIMSAAALPRKAT